ncbi:MAG: hypothetical protein M1351_05060 [Candidatus Thermoplasmatota archaeon]|nr:hypothetical protein [Candidatus Thermoplasmatota archaeon]
MNNRLLYLIVAVQVVIAFGMWYISLLNPVRYQSAWAIMLGAEFILTASILLMAMRFFVGGGYGK